MNELKDTLVRTLLMTDPGKLVTHPVTGNRIAASELLQELMTPEGALVRIPSAQSDTPNNVAVSQRAVDGLSARDYEELQRTGHIEGLTTPLQTVRVTVKESFSYKTHAAIDPDTGDVHTGLAMPPSS